jgi:hypothetical protein
LNEFLVRLWLLTIDKFTKQRQDLKSVCALTAASDFYSFSRVGYQPLTHFNLHKKSPFVLAEPKGEIHYLKGVMLYLVTNILQSVSAKIVLH